MRKRASRGAPFFRQHENLNLGQVPNTYMGLLGDRGMSKASAIQASSKSRPGTTKTIETRPSVRTAQTTKECPFAGSYPHRGQADQAKGQ